VSPTQPQDVLEAASGPWRGGAAVPMFLAFAFAYFLSTLLRAVTATLAPVFGSEMGLNAADLGLLAGAYFLGFSLTQLPLGKALDRFGSRRALCVLLVVAALSCVWFAHAQSLGGLVASRVAIGVGVSACLMAPLTMFRLTLDAQQQMRTNAWMLMTGSLGMTASTLPVQWLLPSIGWRGLFLLVAALLAVSIVGIFVWVPSRGRVLGLAPFLGRSSQTGSMRDGPVGYREIFTHPRFVALIPAGMFIYGGMVAVQALWAGPWLTTVVGRTAEEAARGLFFINVSMLITFFAWGMVMPRLSRAGVSSHRLMRWGLLVPLAVLIVNLVLGPDADELHWALWCVTSTVITLSQPLVAQEFPAAVAGRALSAFNLVMFVGIFMVQWSIGLAIDAFVARGWGAADAHRGAFAVFAGAWVLSYAWYLWCESGRPAPKAEPAA
jgi:MFS family permease